MKNEMKYLEDRIRALAVNTAFTKNKEEAEKIIQDMELQFGCILEAKNYEIREAAEEIEHLRVEVRALVDYIRLIKE